MRNLADHRYGIRDTVGRIAVNPGSEERFSDLVDLFHRRLRVTALARTRLSDRPQNWPTLRGSKFYRKDESNDVIKFHELQDLLSRKKIIMVEFMAFNMEGSSHAKISQNWPICIWEGNSSLAADTHHRVHVHVMGGSAWPSHTEAWALIG